MRPEYPLAAILRFLGDIGIEVRQDRVTESFLPGVRIERGALVFDPESLRWPGDLLHEAGHIAMTPSSLRPALNDTIDADPAGDAEAIAWSYAAIVAMGLDPAVLFHSGGYKGRSESLLFTYALGVYPGAYALAQAGLTSPGAYPRMTRWLRD